MKIPQMNTKWFLMLATLVLALWACESKPRYTGPSPVDKMVRDMMDEKTFSIVLFDMQVDEDKDLYQHKYRITVNTEDSTAQPKTTEWVNVDEVFFAENLDNMGLELASKSPDGTIHKVPSPPGFNGYVGNERYGQWRNDNSGNSFWAFYGQYMFMSTMFNMMAGPTYRNTYSGYQTYRSNPSTRNQPYYGSGNNRYGTNSPATRASNPNFFQRKQQMQKLSSFKQKVASNPSRYSRSSSARTSRSTSRTGSSSRSRGSSFGK
ncbi:MAG: hypothetical protein HC913_19125 [Microscillaceae bacterium]|nr:hypothetical protein [Microscillaceae bacterium]